MKRVIFSVLMILFVLPVQAQSEPASLFSLPGTWQDSFSKEFTYKDFAKHRISIVAMVFTHCQAACPIIISQLKKLAKALPDDAEQRGIVFKMFSFDYERDNPTSNSAYLKEHKLNSSLWNMYSSDEVTVRKLALVLGVKYKRDEFGDFEHSNLVTIINAKGEIIIQLNAVTIDIQKALAAINLK
ncbi:MAG: SCO family protein [Methylacidiphilales bacterium]|nr:SCO family protein [Candidatus Methylacidiphilales bacterium]